MELSRRSVSNVIARDALRAAGLERQASAVLLHSNGLTEETLLESGGRLLVEEHALLLRAVEEAAPKARLFQHDLTWLFQHFPNLAAVCSNGLTQRDAISEFLKYGGLISDAQEATLQEFSEHLEIELQPAPGVVLTDRCAFGFFSILAAVARQYEEFATTALHVEVPDASLIDFACVPTLGARVMNGGSSYRISLEKRFLDEPFTQHNPLLREAFGRRLAEEHRKLVAQQTVGMAVERLVREQLSTDSETAIGTRMLEHVCGRLNVTRWTLRRRLQEEGTSYQAIVFKLRASRAADLLRLSSLSLGEISDSLGFSSQSSFTRFFKDSKGVTPLQYRHEHRNGNVAPRPHFQAQHCSA